MTLGQLEKFIKGIKKLYGRKASKMEIEVHHPYQHGKETFWGPHEAKFAVATYPEDKEDNRPEETVVVIR